MANNLGTMKGTSESGRQYPIGYRYDPPSPEVCEILIHTFPKISETKPLDRMTLAKKLIALYSGPGKKDLNTSNISSSFSWMYQAGLLDYKNVWRARGGWQLEIWRTASPEVTRKILSDRPSYLNGDPIQNTVTCASASSSVVEGASSIVGGSGRAIQHKTKKKCCDNPKIVRKKTSGKRRCKNCGTKFKSRKLE